MDVFKVFSLDSIPPRLWSRSLTFQVLMVGRNSKILVLHRFLKMLLGKRFKGVFSTFSPAEKKVRRLVRARGRNWVRTLLHPRRRLSWRVLFTDAAGVWNAVSRWLVETSGLGSRSLAAWVMGGTGALVLRQPTYAFERIPCPMCSRSSHLESGAFFPLSLFLAVFVPGAWGVAEEFGKFDFSGDVFFCGCNAWFDSGYLLCDSTLVASDVFHTFSTLRRTRILKHSFSTRFEWRSVPSRRFWLLSCSAQLALGNLEVLFTSFTWLRCVIRARIFWSTCVSHRCRGAGPTRESDSGLAGTHAN